MRAICDEHDVLFAADEVITGFGRTGRMFALEHWGVEPDLISVREGDHVRVLPVRRRGPQRRDRGGPRQRYDALDARVHLQRASGRLRRRSEHARHPGSRSAARLERRRSASALLERLRAALGDHPQRRRDSRPRPDVRGRVRAGSRDEGTVPGEREGRHAHQCRSEARGLFSRNRGDIYMLAPPFVVTTEQIDRIVDILDDSVRAVLGTSSHDQTAPEL